MKQKIVKILFIGNSFSCDTCEYLVDIAKSLNVKVKLLNLYIGGCSINKHYNNLIYDNKDYCGYLNEGLGFKEINNLSIKEAILSDSWDYIGIQHGTLDGSRYSNINSYINLIPLIENIKKIINNKVKIFFNMTWVGEANFNHHEIIKYHGDTKLLYNKIATLTKNHLLPLKQIDIISPTGTAIQIARQKTDKLLTCDGYHLSLDLGRYIAALTLFKALTNINIDNINFNPTQNEKEKEIAISSANEAISLPFKIFDN